MEKRRRNKMILKEEVGQSDVVRRSDKVPVLCSSVRRLSD